ncbi:MAG TPA: RNA repair domain-containing protein [Candidatus Nanoarchaeia archaeon]|nr:RNA repair domain-containing protein [Candidatus Nanoarchaeia archaeon]
MISNQEIKRYFWFILGIMGVVFLWIGIWDGIGSLPYIHHPLVSLAAGILMLSLSKVIFRGADPLWGSAKKPIFNVLTKVSQHLQKHEFDIKYEDRIKKREIMVGADKLKEIEKGFLVFLHNQQEIFIPLHRVTEVLHLKKTHWKK